MRIIAYRQVVSAVGGPMADCPDLRTIRQRIDYRLGRPDGGSVRMGLGAVLITESDVELLPVGRRADGREVAVIVPA